MTTIGLHKIVGQMFRGPLTLTEITKFSGLKKPTVHYHMQNLIEQGVVHYDKKKGTYFVKINDELKNTILNSLKNKKTLEELSNELKIKSKNSVDSSPMKLLIKDKELSKKLNDILEFLYLDDLVTVIQEHILSGTIFKTVEFWTLTWKGCSSIGLCYVCKNPINEQKNSSSIAHIININAPDFSIYYSPLIHPTCVSRASSEYIDYYVGEHHYEDDLCNYCGLPLSEKRLRSWMMENSKNTGFMRIFPFLTLDEIDQLNEIRKNELVESFTKQFDKKPALKTFEGNVLTKNKFNDEKCGEFESGNKLFEFLKIPALSDVEKLLKLTHSKTTTENLKLRAKELFQAWLSAHKIAEDKIDQLIQPLFSNPAAMIYPKVWHTLPGPHNLAAFREQPLEFGGFPESDGYAFVIKDKENYHYHEGCFHNFTRLNQIQEKSQIGGSKK